MAGHEWKDWFEREEFIGQISDMRVQNLQVEREVVQKRTFTRWMNLHLEKCDPPITVIDLFQDIQDGHILMTLLEELSGCKLLHGFKKSSHRIFRLNNIAKVLSFLEERNVKLVSIDAADVADGNSSIILGLIWNIILFFQIKELTGNIRSQFPSSSSLSSIPISSDTDTTFSSTPSDKRQSVSTAMREQSKAINKLLQWVQRRTRKFSVTVQDFGKSWTSGLAFLAVIKSIDPSLVDMRKALLRPARENLEEAFRTAHYSLGIPCLLEPEDVTMNAPDEQSIMTYVSQFLEHFPGIEQPELPCQLIERSISMCRFTFRDSDSDHIGSSAHGVRERTSLFQRDSAKPPPKILVSSVSADRGMSRSFTQVAARSRSIEDFVTDSPHKETISSSVAKEPKESASEVSNNSTSNLSQFSCTHSSTGSSVPESLSTESFMGDSAISSPDSWVESEFGIKEKFCESQSDSSLCDSGTAWVVYRATPVEITTLDEGFVPYIDDRSPVDQSYIDEEIYPLCPLERIQGNSVNKQAAAGRMQEANLDDHHHDIILEQVPNCSKTEIIKEVNSKQMDTNLLKQDEVPREEEFSLELCDAKSVANPVIDDVSESEKPNQLQLISNTELPPSDHFEELKQASVEGSNNKLDCLRKPVDFIGDGQDHEGQFHGQTGQNESNNAEEVKIQDQKTDSPESNEANELVLRDYLESAKRLSPETCEALANTHPTYQDGAFKTGLDSSGGINIPLISVPSEPEERICDPEQHDGHDENNEVHQVATGRKGVETDVQSPASLVSQNVNPTKAGQIIGIESEPLNDADEHAIQSLVNADICGADTVGSIEKGETKTERGGLQHDLQTDNTEKDLLTQSSTTAKSQPVNTKQEIDLTVQQEGPQGKVTDTFSNSKTATKQQDILEPVDSKHIGAPGISCCETGSLSGETDLFYTDFDQNSPTDDLLGDPIEPMDLFYPDKEESLFTETHDMEMQSWPSVLSVSALKLAPVSDDQTLSILGEDFRIGVDLIQENIHVTTNNNQETDKSPESKEHGLLPKEKIGGLWGCDVPAGSSDLRAAEQQSSGSARENTEPMRSVTTSSSKQNESQIPPVLRHRKGLCFTDSMDNQPAVTPKADSGVSETWWSEGSELYLLLLLWLLLYCFWLLPQLDLKTLPGLLLNLKD